MTSQIESTISWWMFGNQAVILGLYIFGACIISRVHSNQHGEKAWTPEREEAWNCTLRNLTLGYLAQCLASIFNVGSRLYDGYPSPFRIALELTIFTFIEDFLFYWSHRALHCNQWVYKKFHAYHHRAHKDVSLVNGLQVTLVELILSIVIPGFLPPFFIPHGMNRILFQMMCYISVFGVIADHGWDVFPHKMIPIPLNGIRHHKRHHERVQGNYSGPLSFWDFVCFTHLGSS